MILDRPSRFNALSEEEVGELREKIRDDRPNDFAEFIKALKTCGYEVKGLNHKYVSVRAQGQKRFTRLNARTLGDDYSRENLTNYIEETNSPALPETDSPAIPGPRLGKIIDVKNNAKANASVGYERWAKLQNLRTLADTHSYMAANDLTFADVIVMVNEKTDEIAVLENMKDEIIKLTGRQKEIGVLQNNLINYVKNRKAFEEYKRGGYSKAYKAENAEALEAYGQARKYFDEYKAAHGTAKLPTMQELKSEYAELKEKKSGYYADLKARREELRLLQVLKTNAMELLGVDENGGRAMTAKEEIKERGALIKAQRERFAQERNYKSRKKKFR